MLTPAHLGLALGLIANSFAASEGWTQRFEDDTASASAQDEPAAEDDGEKSGGGLFGALFGSGDKTADGPLIDQLNADQLDLPAADPKQPAGRELARREAQGSDAVPVPVPPARVVARRVALRLMTAAGARGFEPKVEIVAVDSIWAAAFPDGTILVSLGTLRNLKSEDEFAAIIGHELSHVLLRHYKSDWFMASQERGLAAFNLALDTKQALQKQGIIGDGRSGGADLKQRLIAETIVFTSEVLLDAPFNRAQEDEADLLGTDLLIKAAYNPTGMTRMLSRLAAQEARIAEAKERAAEARQQAEQAVAGDGLTGFFSGLGNALSHVGDTLKSDIRDQFGNNHRTAEDRRATVSRYVAKHYGNVARVRLTIKPWRDFLKDRKVVAALLGYRAALQARSSLVNQDLPTAVERLNQAFAALPETSHILPRTVAAEISAATGNFAAATAYYRQALSGYLPTTGDYAGLSEALTRQGDMDAAALIVADGMAAIGQPPQLLPAKIAIARLAAPGAPNRNWDVAGIVAECRLEGIKPLEILCKQAAKGEYSTFLVTAPPGSGKVRIPARNGSGSGARRIEIAADNLNARAGPSTGHPVVASFRRGQTLPVVAQDGKWLRVRGPDGKTVWLAGWLTKPAASVGAALPAPTLAAAPGAQPRNDSPGGDDIAAQLRKLRSLRDQDLISEAEYTEKRQEILARF